MYTYVLKLCLTQLQKVDVQNATSATTNGMSPCCWVIQPRVPHFHCTAMSYTFSVEQ